jgi:hypothetical protein
LGVSDHDRFRLFIPVDKSRIPVDKDRDPPHPIFQGIPLDVREQLGECDFSLFGMEVVDLDFNIFDL